MTLVVHTINFQAEVAKWGDECFAPVLKDARDPMERARRYLEESLELVQAVGLPKEQALQLVEYTFGRPLGEPKQEVGGCLVTLAYLCEVEGVNMVRAGNTELARIQQPEVIEKIRKKQVSKQLHGIGGTPATETSNG